MKPQSVFLSSVACLLLTAASALAEGQEWELIDTTPNVSDFFYDKAATTASPDGIVTVTVKVIYLPEGKKDTLELLKNDKRYADLANTLYTYDLNCDAGMQRLQRVRHYDTKGLVIREFNLAGKTEWEKVPTDSRMELVNEQACPEVKELSNPPAQGKP